MTEKYYFRKIPVCHTQDHMGSSMLSSRKKLMSQFKKSIQMGQLQPRPGVQQEKSQLRSINVDNKNNIQNNSADHTSLT